MFLGAAALREARLPSSVRLGRQHHAIHPEEKAAVAESSCAAYGCSSFNAKNGCQCNAKCAEYRNCCPDYEDTCLVDNGEVEAASPIGVRSLAAPPAPPPPRPPHWCDADAGSIKLQSGPNMTGATIYVKVLTYNLAWKRLFAVGDHGARAQRLVAASMLSRPYDIMGFQECEDVEEVLNEVRPGQYRPVRGRNMLCIAFRQSHWSWLSHGEVDVAEDLPSQFTGNRTALWLRLRHEESGKIVFFLTIQGPLPVNTGGICGRSSTVLNVMNVVAEHAWPGDAVILAGDFSAEVPKLPYLMENFHHVLEGTYAGGVDAIVSNVGGSAVIETTVLGTGGGEHNALSALIEVGPHQTTSTTTTTTTTSTATTTTTTTTTATTTTATTTTSSSTRTTRTTTTTITTNSTTSSTSTRKGEDHGGTTTTTSAAAIVLNIVRQSQAATTVASTPAATTRTTSVAPVAEQGVTQTTTSHSLNISVVSI